MRTPSSARLRARLDRWLFRVGPPEAAPIVLVQRRVFLLPTRAGLAFAAALLVMLLAAINYNLSLGYALVFLLGGVAVASIVHAFHNLLHLSLRPGRAEPVFAGDSARFAARRCAARRTARASRSIWPRVKAPRSPWHAPPASAGVFRLGGW
jgi:hypothetical protein